MNTTQRMPLFPETPDQKFKRELAQFRDIGEFARKYKITISENPETPCQPSIFVGLKKLSSTQNKMVIDRFIAMYEDTKTKLMKLDVPCGNVAGIINNTIKLTR